MGLFSRLRRARDAFATGMHIERLVIEKDGKPEVWLVNTATGETINITKEKK